MPDGSAFHVEFQTPWKRCRSAIQFLVEPVAQTPNSLRYQQARSDGVSQQGHWIVLMTAPYPCGQRSEQHAAPDAKSAIPNAEHFRPVAIRSEETFRRGDDVIKSCADNARRHADQSDIKHLVEIATQLFPTCGGYPYCKDDSHQNAQRIDMNRYWTDGKLRNRWRWNVCKCHGFLMVVHASDMVRGPPKSSEWFTLRHARYGRRPQVFGFGGQRLETRGLIDCVFPGFVKHGVHQCGSDDDAISV